MNNITSIKRRKRTRVYNHSGSCVFIPLYTPDNRNPRDCKIEGAKNNRPTYVDLTWDDICHINDNTNGIKNGTIRFADEDKEAIYKELGIENWENILFDEVIDDILLNNPTIENLQRILNIKDVHEIERVRGRMLFHINNGIGISTKAVSVINGRWKEINHNQRNSNIVLSPVADIKPADKGEVNELKNQVAELKAMFEQLSKKEQ